MSQKRDLQEIEDEIEDLYYDLFDAQLDHDWKLADKVSARIRELEAELKRLDQLARRG